MLATFKKILGLGKRPTAALGRNDPCWCGSGQKYKRCCLEKDRLESQAQPRKPAGPRRAPVDF